MNAPSDQRLMQYFDGEVGGDEARAIEEWLDGSERARLVRSSFERVGDAVRAIGGDVGKGGDGIADAVMARLGESMPEGPVRRLAAARAGARRSTRLWRAFTPAVGLAVAAAAIIALDLRHVAPPSHASPGPSGIAVVSPESRVPPNASETVAIAETPEPGASIESVDFGAVAGTIFLVPSDSNSDESETPVVWLMDEPSPNEGRMAPL